MILVDSCVWIDHLKGHTSPQVDFLATTSLTLNRELCINHIIFFEVLRGISSDKERRRMQQIFLNFEFFDHLNKDFEKIIVIYRECLKKGFTLSKLGDWLIFKSVMDHDIELLTSDQDFFRLNKVHPFRLIG